MPLPSPTFTWLSQFESKDGQSYYLQLDRLNFGSIQEEGVYVVWRAETVPVSYPPERPGLSSKVVPEKLRRAVRVGQGAIGARLGAHSRDPEVCRQGTKESALHAEWLAVPAHQRDGVELYLANLLKPIVGSAFPRAIQLSVPLPPGKWWDGQSLLP